MPRPENDATIDWMTNDIAARCRVVVATLSRPGSSLTSLDEAASTLRGAADDLASLLVLLDGAGSSHGSLRGSSRASAFDLALGVPGPIDGQ